jgi:hypothetical protein
MANEKQIEAAAKVLMDYDGGYRVAPEAAKRLVADMLNAAALAALEAPREPSDKAVREVLRDCCSIEPGDNYDASHPRVRVVLNALRIAYAVDFPAAPPAPAGDGWRLVPENATREMIDAWRQDQAQGRSLENSYRVMIAAAPPTKGG